MVMNVLHFPARKYNIKTSLNVLQNNLAVQYSNVCLEQPKMLSTSFYGILLKLLTFYQLTVKPLSAKQNSTMVNTMVLISSLSLGPRHAILPVIVDTMHHALYQWHSQLEGEGGKP